MRLNFHLFGRGKSSVLLDVNCHTCSCFVHVCAISFSLRKGLHMSSFKICICLCLSLTVLRWHCVVHGWQGAEIQLQTVHVDNCQCFGHHCYVNFVCVYKREIVGVDVHERGRKCVCEREREREIVVHVCACTCTHSLLESLWVSVNSHLKHFSLSHTHTHTCAHTHKHPIFHIVHVYFFVPDSLLFMN